MIVTLKILHGFCDAQRYWSGISQPRHSRCKLPGFSAPFASRDFEIKQFGRYVTLELKPVALS